MVLRKRLAVLLATVMMLGVMPAAPALAYNDANEGNKAYDGSDHNFGGGQEKPKNPNHQNGRAE